MSARVHPISVTALLAAPPQPRITDQAVPAFLMSAPFALASETRRVSLPRALRQFRELYAFVAAHALVYLLPSRAGLPQQPFVASLGAVLPHLPESTLVVARLHAAQRRAERAAGIAFFRELGVPFEPAPAPFEGEADLAHLGGNAYVGGAGRHTSERALAWLERRFEMELIRFPLRSERLAHLDACLFPITREEALVCTAAADRAALRAIERHVGVIDVSREDAESGITRCVRIGEFVLCASGVERLDAGDPAFARERSKLLALDEICAKRGLEPVLFDLSELERSGAGLSSLVMHLNHANF